VFLGAALTLAWGGLIAIPALAAPGPLVEVVATGPESLSAGDAAASAGRYAAQSNVEVFSGAGGSVVTVATTDPEAVIAQMEASGLYRGVGLNGWYHPAGLPAPDDPVYTDGDQYALLNGQGAAAWGSTTLVGARFDQAWPKVGGADATAPIAVVDTALPHNPSSELSNIAKTWDVTGSGAGDSDARLPAAVTDSEMFHGAHVASIIGAKTGNGAAMAGAAQNTQIYFYKTLADADALAGTEDMAFDAVASGIRRAYSDGAKVINLSLGSTCMASSQWTSDPTYLAIQDVVARGVTVVAAAGNYAAYGNPLSCPGAYPGVIGVGATNPNGTWASFSEYNTSVDISAPGVDIAYAETSAGYVYFGAGTSYASPLVAAAAGLLKRTNTSLTPAQIESVLKHTAQDAGSHGYDTKFGYGVLDAGKALDYAFQPSAATDQTKGYVPHATQVLLSPDMNGDGRGDVLVVDGTDIAVNGKPGAQRGKLWLYPMTAAGTLGSPILLGAGWGNLTVYAPGDWNGDGKADILARTTAGDLLLYPGTGKGALQASRKVGNGWNGYTVVPAGDLNGDGRNDLLAVRESTGKLHLYRGNGKGGFVYPYPQVGNGWQGYQLYAAGDLNGDGRSDILSVSPGHFLFRYLGRGDGTFLMRKQVGNGWGGFQLAAGASLDGDAYADIVGLAPDWKLYFYKGRGGGSFAMKKQIGSGF
jgi:hypothetical protein